jgi:hypothetical protein
MYSHHKNNGLRHYLKSKAWSADATLACPLLGEPDHLADLVAVFDIEKMQDMLKIHDRKSNLHRNHLRFLTYLEGTSGFLRLNPLPLSIFNRLDQLGLRFPNFVEVIEFYREQFALALLNDTPCFSAAPLLMVGPPGVGKTAFCQALAKLIGTHFELVSLSGLTAGFVIGGMSSSWADGKPGRIVEALARSQTANPLMVLDELDKGKGDSRYDPFGALYQLLEKETSANFIDEGLEIASDCSHIVWIATANDCLGISEPMLSRFTLIAVQPPTPEQMKAVLMSIYHKIQQYEGWGSQFEDYLCADLVEKIIGSEFEPRWLQRELIAACGKAALRNSPHGGKHRLSADDFRPRQHLKRLSRIGFV